MSKGYKVRRYGYDRRQQKKRRTAGVILTVAIIVGACVAGWFLFEPVSEWVKDFAEEQKHKIELQKEESQKPKPEKPTPDNPDQEPEEPPAPETAAFPALTVQLSPAELLDPAALTAKLQKLKAEGYDAVLFDLKDKDGAVLYESALPAVLENPSQQAARFDLAEVIRKVKEAGLTPVGRLYAFRDRLGARGMPEAAVKFNYTETNWIDNSADAGGKSWLNPVSPQAQDYLLALLEEAAGAGLETIVLDGVQFPEGYSLELATYAAPNVTVDKSAVLAGFLEKAVARVEAKNATLWTTFGVSVTAGVNEVRCGTDPAKVIKAARHVVVDVAPAQFGAGLTHEKLTLTAPVKSPYETVKAALSASPVLKTEGLTLAASVQGYTAPWIPAEANLSYGKEQIDQQLKAVKEFGVEHAIVNPIG